MKKRLTLRQLLAAGAVLLALAAAVPYFFSADRYAATIRASLERALQRKVEIGKARFHLLTGPGFSVEDVVIHDDLANGLEPVAYVTSLEARLHWRSLFTRRLEFSSLTLVSPSVNLTKGQDGTWNFQALLRAIGESQSGTALPRIEVREGRMNFKFGSLKAGFYLTNADLDLSPISGRSKKGFHIELSAEPARTDRAAQGFGRFNGWGEWTIAANSESRLDMDLELERSAIGEVLALVDARTLGVHGSVSSRARISGPISNLAITGQIRLEDIHRGDLLAFGGRERTVNYRGSLDLIRHRLELETQADAPAAPVSVRVVVSESEGEPRWGVTATMNGVSAASLLDAARQVNAPINDSLMIDGPVFGVLGYSFPAGVQGQLSIGEGTLQAGTKTFKLDRAHLLIDGDRLQLSQARVRSATGELLLSATYDRRSETLDLRLTSPGLAVTELHSGSGMLFGLGGVPVLDACSSGVFRGSLRHRRAADSPGEWSGTFRLEKATIPLPGVAEPLRIISAGAAVRGASVSLSDLTGRIGGMSLTARFSQPADASHPQELAVSIPRADISELERLFLPTLRRQRGFLARALRRPSPPPKWLSERRLEGRVSIGHLDFAGVPLEQVQGTFQWKGAEVDLTSLHVKLMNSSLDGRLQVRLSGQEPQYRLSGKARRLPFRGGQLDIEGLLEASGTGSALWTTLVSRGVLEARSVAIGDEEAVAMAGAYQLSVSRGAPRLQVNDLELTLGQETYYGKGGSLTDGRLQFDLISGQKALRLVGNLYPPRFEFALSR